MLQGVDLSSEHEDVTAEEHFKAPVVVKTSTKDIKAFYMRLNEDGKTVAAMDVLAPRHRRDYRRFPSEERLGIDARPWQRWGLTKTTGGIATCVATASMPHSGFGLGFERLISVTGMQNVPRCYSFPRTPPALRHSRIFTTSI
ncbi:hypothetical protein MJ575_10655 [Klebsiella pneumoniae]|nr:hypothetical protein MJ575_10655 [Klebsiella pneumoniae]